MEEEDVELDETHEGGEELLQVVQGAYFKTKCIGNEVG